MILRNPYRNDFDHRPEVNRRGRFRDHFYYTGDIYRLPMSPARKRKSTVVCTAYFFGMLASLVIGGLVNPDSSRTWYVVIPYLIVFLPVFLFAMGIISYGMAEIQMTRAEYDKGVRRMKDSAQAAMFCVILAVIGDLIFCLLHAAEIRLTMEIVYLAALAVLFAVLIGFGRFYSREFGGIQVSKVQ